MYNTVGVHISRFQKNYLLTESQQIKSNQEIIAIYYALLQLLPKE